MTDRIELHVVAGDWLPGAFGAYGAPADGFHSPAQIRLSVPVMMAAVSEGDLAREDVWRAMMTTVVHEVGHALEHWLRLEFSEERVDGFVAEIEKVLEQGRVLPEGMEPCEVCDGMGIQTFEPEEADPYGLTCVRCQGRGYHEIGRTA